MLEIGYLVGGGLFLTTLSFVVGNMKGESNKRGEMYKHIEEKYVTKEVSEIRYENLEGKLDTVIVDVKKLLTRRGGE